MGESLLRAHDKRLKNIGFHEGEYQQQIQDEETSVTMVPGLGHKPSEVALQRLQDAMDKSTDKSKAFSRRRMFNADEDVNYVNERNRVFNKKLARSFDPYTVEIRQNLERGTAL